MSTPDAEKLYTDLVDMVVGDLTKAKELVEQADSTLKVLTHHVAAMDPSGEASQLLSSTTLYYDALLIDSAIRAVAATKQ